MLQLNLAHVHQLCNGRHELLYHPASRRDIQRDNDAARRACTLRRQDLYRELPEGPACPWNVPGTSENDKCDDTILFALERDAAHVLVIEDRGLHRKALAQNLASRVYFIQNGSTGTDRQMTCLPSVSMPCRQTKHQRRRRRACRAGPETLHLQGRRTRPQAQDQRTVP